MAIPEKIKEFMFSPSHAFRKVKDEEAGETIKYIVILAVFYAIMATVMTALRIFIHPFSGFFSSPGDPALDPLLMVASIISIVAVTLIFAVIFGFWLHVWVYLLGGRKGVWQTEKSVFYSATPSFILAWIPIIGTLVGIVWTVIINVIGIKELQGLNDTRAALSVILGVVIAVIIVVLILGAMLLAVVSSLPMTV